MGRGRVDACLDGSLAAARPLEVVGRHGQEPSEASDDGLETWLSPDERSLLAFLERRAADVQRVSATARGVA